MTSGAVWTASCCGFLLALVGAPTTGLAQGSNPIDVGGLIQRYSAFQAQVQAQTQAIGQMPSAGVQVSSLLKLQLEMNILSLYQSTAVAAATGLQDQARAITKSVQGGTNALSCPVFVGEGTLLGEDRCVWSQVRGEWASHESIYSAGRTWTVGAQDEIAPGWYLGGAFSIGDSSSSSGNAVWSRAQSFEGSVALKHTMGPWLFAGAMFVDLASTHLTRPTGPAASSVLQSDANTYTSGVRLRGAYDFAFADWYVRPRFDLALTYTDIPGYQEYGQSPFALAVAGRSMVRSSLHPAVEIGGRYNLDATTIVRSYVILGASVLPDNTATVDASFVGPLAVLGTFRTPYTGPNVLGTGEAGVQVYRVNGGEVRVEYKLLAGQAFVSQSLGLRGAWHF